MGQHAPGWRDAKRPPERSGGGWNGSGTPQERLIGSLAQKFTKFFLNFYIPRKVGTNIAIY
jgi:hypothetical protein